jgi:putative transposase
VGIKEVSDKVWLVSFMQYDLSFFDHETGREPAPRTPSAPKCYLCARYETLPMCSVRTLIRWSGRSDLPCPYNPGAHSREVIQIISVAPRLVLARVEQLGCVLRPGRPNQSSSSATRKAPRSSSNFFPDSLPM